jgi:curved DNA-binding protein CbpA
VAPQQSTLYEVLGLETDATTNDIRAAFRRLTREHHPDRYSGDERERAEQRFQAITEAFNVLSRPDQKEKYDRELSHGGGAGSQPSNPKEIARRLAAAGAQALRDGNVPEAMEHLRLAINHDDDCSRAHYFLGMAYGRLDGRERDALRHMERAAQLEPTNAAMKAEVADLFAIVGMSSRARRAAREALSLDPTSSKAAAVLDRLDEPEKASPDGLLGRLRRKG